MASFDEVKLEDILYGTFATFNPNTGDNKDANSTPSIIVYEEGNSSPMSVATSVTNMTTGRYRWQCAVQAASGFEQGKFYDVWVSGTVTGTDTVTQIVPIMSFKATSGVVDDAILYSRQVATGVVDSNIVKIDGSTLNTHAIGMFPADVRDWAGLNATIAVDAENFYPAVSVNHFDAAAYSGVRTAIGMATNNLDSQLSAIATATNAGDLASKVADSGSVITGTIISNTYASTASDDNVFWITAPAPAAVSGYGLRQSLIFNLPLNRVATQLQIRGYWAGNPPVNVFAYNTRTGVYNQLTNTNTNMASRTTEALYSITIPVDYIDTSGGVYNIVTIELRTTSINTTYRLNLDRVLLYHIDEEAPFTMTIPTVNDIWNAPVRTLTDNGSDPIASPTVIEISSGVWSDILTAYTGVVGGAAEAMYNVYNKTAQLTFSTGNQLDVSIHSVTYSGFDDIFQTYQMTESYAATGVAPTPAQAAFLSQQAFTNFNIVGTTISVVGIDGVTVQATYGMDSATIPTRRIRLT